MAFEVFDDVAFFYLAMSVVAMAVLPWSLFKAVAAVRDAFAKPQLVPLTRIQKLKLAQQKNGVGVNAGTVTVQPAAGSVAGDAVAKSTAAASGLTQENLRPTKPWLSTSNIILGLLWLLFIYMLFQIPTFQDQNLASFKPYEILQIDSKATDAEIKAAYRRQSLEYHPDRNKSPEAAQQFMLIAKAYETLTSETAKKNIEKYGNPDGYQGVSVTIGLPSMLTKKENEMRVLVIYFFIFMVLPPLFVWMWWRRAKDYVEGGILKKTIALWFQHPISLMLSNMPTKDLIEFVATAAENEALLSPQFPTDVNDFKKLALEVRPHQGKQRFQDASKFGTYFQYAAKASVLLHAYLLRIPIPRSLQPDLLYVLKDINKLLMMLLELALARQYTRTVFGIFDLMQLIAQGCFVHDSPLLQLPHITKDDVRKLQHKNIKSIHQLVKAPQERLAKILPEYTDAQWTEVRSTSELIPEVEMTHKYEVEDEVGLYEGDLVTLKVSLARVSFNPDKPDAESGYRLSQFDSEEGETVAASASSKGKKNKSVEMEEVQSTSNEEKKEGDFSLSGGIVSAPVAPATDASTDAAASAVADRPLTDDEILDSLPVPKSSKSSIDIRASGPSVHSLTYPYPRRERWFVLLVEKIAGKQLGRIIGFQKVESFFDDAMVDLKFYAPKAKGPKEGDHEYEIHAICDSYIGVDQIATFTLKVDQPRGTNEEVEKRAIEKVQEEYEELARAEEEEAAAEEEYGPWYYLWFPTFWELVLNMLVLALLCVFIFNFLHSRGYWQKYVQPGTDFIGHYTRPIFDALYPYVAPAVDPIRSSLATVWNFCSDMLHREPFPKHPDDVVIDEANIPGMGQEE